ncbi:MAG: 6-bladed beta-propeller [Verrucomicrobia bacterium]|nr:6-bladed beta-propeller [Verrucomicrobiota bacterium]
MTARRPTVTRRRFLTSAAVTTVAVISRVRAATPAPVLGHGRFRYRVVTGWGVLGADTPVKDCHGLAVDREGHIILLTNHTANNVIVYDRAGRLVHKWGTRFPGAHGLSLVSDGGTGGREVLFITDLTKHLVVKTTLDGTVLDEWRWPQHTGKYEKEDQFRPSWTLHLPNGEFFTLDGYGRDYITHHGADGKFKKIFGGQEGGIAHWGPHGGMADTRDVANPTLLIAMSDQQHLQRLALDGRKLERVDMPGGNPRQIRLHDGHFFVAHLADNWPKDRNSRGFVSVLDARLRVVSNLAGTAPEYGDDGALRPMKHVEEIFMHPHDVIVDREGSVYVAQFSSGNTYPIKLERV